jgi:eukaryotic-like serine/threonine-protein kinase
MARNWKAGDLIMKRYRLVSLLGQGGMGSVWRAEHVELKNLVAIKLLDPAISQNQEMIGRFLREARAAASLQNRHVIQIFDHGVEDGEAFMVMELLEGESLGERLQKGPLSVDDTIRFMSQVMRAMGKAHDAGIIHRDLKPDNIFITYDDEGEYAKVLDFGVAKVGGDLTSTNGIKTQTGMMLGTPFYMSPEQAKAKKVDARTDVWALAVITYECLVGKRPFTGDSFADLVLTLCNAPIPIPSQAASVPMGFDEWFVHATQRDVDKRFRSARDMANELVQLANAPLTGIKGKSSYAHGGAAPRASLRTPVGANPAQRGKMSLTTGQRSALGIDSRTPPARSQSQGNGVWIFASVAMVLLTVGAGVYAWRTSGSATAEDTTAASDSLPAHDAEQDEKDTLEAEPNEAPRDEVNEATAAPPAEEVEKPNPKEAQDPVAPPAPTAARPPVSKPHQHQEAEKKPPAQEKSSGSPTGNNVPVVDKAALPPTEWNF